METRANYLVVASFVVAIVALTIVGAFSLLNLRPLPSLVADYEIDFTGSVAGLKVNAPVTLSGIAIGTVRKIENDRVDPSLVHVTVEVQKSAAAVIKRDSVAALDINFILGDASISISAGSSFASPLVVLPGHVYPVIASQPSQLESLATFLADFMQRTIAVSDALLEKLNDTNQQAISDALETVQAATAQAADKARSLGDTIDTYDTMVRDTHRQVAALDATLAGLTEGLQSASTNLDSADNLVKSVGDWIRNFEKTRTTSLDPQLASFRDTMRDLEGLFSSARVVVRGLARSVDDLARNPGGGLFGKTGPGGYKPK